VDLRKVIDAAFDSIRPAAEAKAIGFDTAMPANQCLVLGDQHRLQQIFWNLFSNAVKFTPKGGQVKVSVDGADSRVRISVSDTGIGINPEFLPYIFDRFRQADGSPTREHGGLGLGLAIVRHLVELHYGTVEVESKGKDLGSTFIIAIPVANKASVAEMNGLRVTEESQNMAPLQVAQQLQGVRVLVVDDEPDSRDLLMTIFSRCGSEVRCSESAAHAMQEFESWNPELLVSDIGMPNEDGYSLIRKVRELKSDSARIPAVALTAYATDEDRSQALSAGFQIHVAKPIEPESFVTSVIEVLCRKSAPTA
jgi:CheY-like chemotaxis protein/anti-sigma regulatory factor (Ser/Thr protein kinase)